MQNTGNSNFEVAGKELMRAIRDGREYLVKTREDILNCNLELKEKYEEIFEKLYGIDIISKTEKDVESLSIKKLIGDIIYVYHNNQFDDKEYLNRLVLRIEFAIMNLSLFLETDELEKYKEKLTTFKEDLLSKIQLIKPATQETK